MSNPEDIKISLPKTEEWQLNTKDVIQLTEQTFKKEIKSKEPMLVMFYAPCTYLMIKDV